MAARYPVVINGNDLEETQVGDYVPVAAGGTGGVAASGTLVDNISGFATTGLIARTGAGAYSMRSLSAGTGISITYPDGVSGDPVITATGSGSGGGAGVDVFNHALIGGL